MLDALVDLCRGDPEQRASALGLPPGLADLVARNADLPAAPTARADRVYTGVLYDALALPDLPADARRRATSRVAVVSSLFGLVRPGDRIPAYRLSGDASLPGVGPVAAVWRAALDPVVRAPRAPGWSSTCVQRHQAPGGLVRLVAELLGEVQNLVPDVGLDQLRGPAERARHCRGRDAEFLGDRARL